MKKGLLVSISITIAIVLSVFALTVLGCAPIRAAAEDAVIAPWTPNQFREFYKECPTWRPSGVTEKEANKLCSCLARQSQGVIAFEVATLSVNQLTTSDIYRIKAVGAVCIGPGDKVRASPGKVVLLPKWTQAETVKYVMGCLKTKHERLPTLPFESARAMCECQAKIFSGDVPIEWLFDSDPVSPPDQAYLNEAAARCADVAGVKPPPTEPSDGATVEL